MKKQQGFTLIELMIVVAIVGILAAIAIPAYQDYIKRSKMTEVSASMGACKTSVTEYYQTNNKLPEDEETAGCGSADTADLSQYLGTLTVENGVISAQSQNIDAVLDTSTTSLTPCTESDGASGTCTKPVDESGDPIKSWKCTNDNSAVFKYLPATCRQSASS